MDRITDTASVDMVLKRMITADFVDDIYFRNNDDTIGFILFVERRMDCTFVQIDYDANIPSVERVVEYYYSTSSDRYMKTSFVVEDGTDQHEDGLEYFMKQINGCLNTKICFCKNRFIHDESDICLYCNLKATSVDLEKCFCVVCQEDNCSKMTMSFMDCCGTTLHKGCKKQWMAQKKGCPSCRHA